MRGHSYSSLLRASGGEGGDDRQSPHWSLAPFGFQRQRTSPRQRASPPAAAAAGARTPSAQQQAAAKAAARVELGKYHVEEIQPAGSPSPTAPLRHRSPRTSPRRGFCAGLYSGAVRWVAGWHGSGLAAALLAAVLLGVLLWGGRQLAAQRREELQQWMSYVPAVHPSLAFGAARQAAPTERPQRCQLQLDGSPWERHCQRLRRVCVDQGSLILYEDRYQQMDGRRAGALPELLVDTSKLYEYPWRKTSRRQQDAAKQPAASSGQAAGGSSEAGGSSDGSGAGQRRSLHYEVQDPTRNRRLDPVPLRPATAQEPTPYLQDPVFSSCTVPLLMYPSWRGNFFHIFKDLSAVYYAMLRRTPWRRHAKLVVVTPDGLPLTQPESQLLPTLSELAVQSLADFSRRLLPGHQIGQELDASQPPASFEGGEQRCFQDLFVCGRNFPLARGPAPAEEAALTPQQRGEWLAQEVPIEPFSFGQAVVAYHAQPALAAAQFSRQNGAAGSAIGAKDGISLQEAAAAAAAGAASAAGGTAGGAAGTAAGTAGGPATARAKTMGRLKVLIIKRGGEGRQLLNAAELLQACNAWKWLPPGATEPVTAECREVMFPDLASGIAAAREADVFIGMHGANLANGWLMRPGSSVIELTPYQFETGRGSFVFSITNANDATSNVLWWVGVVCDPAASTPGPTELARRPPEDWWPRDRNSRVPWALMDAALREAVLTGGDQQRYLDRYYKDGLHKWHLLPGGQLQWGGRCPNGTHAA